MSERVVRSPHWVLRDVAGQTVLVPVRDRMPDGVMLFLLDGPVARLVWDELTAGARRVDDLIERVVQAFDVDREAAAADVAEFVRQLTAIRAATLEPAAA